MDDRRHNLRQHIKAAKNWLGKAECSLDKENDVQSDLNLMLAKAELKRAAEKAAACKSNNRRYIIGTVVLTVLLCMLSNFFAMQVAVSEAPIVKETTIQLVKPVADNNAVVTSDDIDKAEKPETIIKKADVLKEESAVRERVAKKPAVKVAEPPKEPVKVPNQNMQKLMQTAGKILREQ